MQKKKQKKQQNFVPFRLVDNQHQIMFQALYIFMPNKPNAFLLNVEPSNLVFLRTYNTNFVKN